jgi:formylmethanofuran dehydrogenase subunit B
MAKKIENVGCPFCGVCCDDLVVTVSDDGKKILEVENACIIGSTVFHRAMSERHTLPRLRQPDGTYKEISYDEASRLRGKGLLQRKETPDLRVWVDQL